MLIQNTNLSNLLLMDMKVLDNLDKSLNNSLELIMDFFANKENKHYENHDLVKNAFKKLYPKEEIKYRDVINSFWTTFVCQLVNWSDKMNNQINKKYFEYGSYTLLKYSNNYGMNDISKERFAEKVVNPENILNKVMNKFINDNFNNKALKFAELTHCVANFMPCPDNIFNTAKGYISDVKDYLPLMIDKIQTAIDTDCKYIEYEIKKEKKRINKKTLQEWHEWFIKNREKYSLQPYYIVKQIDGKDKIIGIPLFKNQSLKYPCPRKKEEVTECLYEIISRTHKRAELMILRINDCI